MKKWMLITALMNVLIGVGLIASSSEPAPFELVKGYIVVSAEYDGRIGDYIIDSGAPGLVLNAERHNLPNSERTDISGVTGQTTAEIVRDRDFVWRIVAIEDIEAISIDLTYLENALGREIAGLIGFEVFHGYDIVIDYDAHTIGLTAEAWNHNIEQDFVQLPLTRHDHILSVDINYGGRTLKFGIDTGSKSNLLNYCMAALLDTSDVTQRGAIILTGADQTDTRTKEISVAGMKIDEHMLEPIEFVLADFHPFEEQYNLKLDGILGHPFFENSKLIIDKDRSHVYLSKQAITGRLVGW